MKDNSLTTIHFRHAGDDAMLREAKHVWWPRIHREPIDKATNCPEFSTAGKKLKCLKKLKKKRKEFGELPATENSNYELLVDFAGSFKRSPKGKVYVGVCTKYLSCTFTDRVIENSAKLVADHGTHQRTNPHEQHLNFNV